MTTKIGYTSRGHQRKIANCNSSFCELHSKCEKRNNNWVTRHTQREAQTQSTTRAFNEPHFVFSSPRRHIWWSQRLMHAAWLFVSYFVFLCYLKVKWIGKKMKTKIGKTNKLRHASIWNEFLHVAPLPIWVYYTMCVILKWMRIPLVSVLLECHFVNKLKTLDRRELDTCPVRKRTTSYAAF